MAIYYALMLAGVIQGLIFSAFIMLSKQYQTKSSYYLVGVMLFTALANLQFTLEEVGAISHYALYNYLFIPWTVLLPLCLYFYVVYFLNPNHQKSKLERYAFTPFYVCLAIVIGYKVMLLSGNISSTNSFIYDFADIYVEFFALILVFIILPILYTKVLKYQKQPITNTRDIKLTQLTWLKVTLIVLFVGMVIWAVFTYRFMEDETIYYYPMYIVVSFLIYWVGYVGIYKIGELNQRQHMRSHTLLAKSAVQTEVVIDVEEPNPRLEKHTQTEVESDKSSIVIDFENRIKNESMYLNPRLSLDIVADDLGVSKTHLSRLINAHLDTSFSNYINTLRVEQSKHLLAHPEFKHYTLLAIGLESGFNSKSTFNKVFKSLVGKTPSAYKTELEAHSVNKLLNV